MTKSNSAVAKYAIQAPFYGQFAWFVSRDDAEEFIRLQPDSDRYLIVELD